MENRHKNRGHESSRTSASLPHKILTACGQRYAETRWSPSHPPPYLSFVFLVPLVWLGTRTLVTTLDCYAVPCVYKVQCTTKRCKVTRELCVTVCSLNLREAGQNGGVISLFSQVYISVNTCHLKQLSYERQEGATRGRGCAREVPRVAAVMLMATTRTRVSAFTPRSSDSASSWRCARLPRERPT